MIAKREMKITNKIKLRNKSKLKVFKYHTNQQKK